MWKYCSYQKNGPYYVVEKEGERERERERERELFKISSEGFPRRSSRKCVVCFFKLLQIQDSGDQSASETYQHKK